MGKQNNDRILLIGENELTGSIAVQLLNAGYEVLLYTASRELMQDAISLHMKELQIREGAVLQRKALQYVEGYVSEVDIAIAITPEEAAQKKVLLKALDMALPKQVVIAVNTETFHLSALTEGTKNPERILGVNWALPAHTTFFLEIITEGALGLEKALWLKHIGETRWCKDPYIVQCGYSIRARLMAALTREALFLVDNGYASVEDIDRANRNDAGYYLPFAGNCRYMDLMGTYAYGLVMKDLNRELSKAATTPGFFDRLVAEGQSGMEAKQGFYNYDEEAVTVWKQKAAGFSYEIKKIIEKYPFNYLQEDKKKQERTSSKINETST